MVSKQGAIKILLVGDSGVGKSSLMLRFVHGTFEPDISSTIGIDFKVKHVDVVDPIDGSTKTVTAQIWDTAGQERFRTLTSSYYRSAHAVVLVYDVHEPSSFEGVTKWLAEANNFLAGEDVVYLLVGNKTDLCESHDSMPVSKATAQRFAQEHKMLFALCSAKTKEGVMHAFEEVVRKVYDKRSKGSRQEAEMNRVDLNNSNGRDGRNAGGGCC